MTMNRLLKFILAFALTITTARATTVVASQPIQDPRGGRFSGRIVFQLPSPATDTSTSTVIVPSPVTIRVNNGVLVASLNLRGNDLLQPKMYYSAYYYDTQGKFITNYNYYVNGTTFDLGTAPLTPITTSNISTNTLTLQSLTVTGDTTLNNLTLFSVAKLTRDCRLDGMVADGVTDDSTAWNNCIVNAVANNQSTVQLPCGPIKVNTSINDTNRPGLHIKGCGTYGTNDNSVVGNITFVKCNTNNACIDTTGSGNTVIEEMTLRMDNTYPTPSTIGILRGRDNALGGGNGRFCFSEFGKTERVTIWADHNMALNAGRGYIGEYNIAAEHQRYLGMKVFSDTDFFFATSNVLGLSSAYQTLQTGCPGSMTSVDFDDVSMTVNGGSGIEAWTTAGFRFNNLVEIDFTANDTAFQAGIASNGTYMIGWDGYVHVENMIATDSFLTMGAATVDKNNLTAFIGGSTGSGSYVNFAGVGQTITDNTFRINTQNEGAGVRQFIANSANTVKGGELWIGTTANPQSATSITLVGTKVYAQGFTDSQVTFGSASDYALQSDTGYSHVTSIGRGKIPYIARLSGDFTDANSAALQPITGLSFSLPAVAANYAYHCGIQFSQATPSAGDQFGIASLITAPTNLTATTSAILSTTTAAYGTAAITNTTPTAAVTFTPAGAGLLAATMDGVIEASGSGASTLQWYVLNGTAANVMVVKKDSFCTIQPQ